MGVTKHVLSAILKRNIFPHVNVFMFFNIEWSLIEKILFGKWFFNFWSYDWFCEIILKRIFFSFLTYTYRVSQKERAPTSGIFLGNKNYLIWHKWYCFSKRISSALTGFLHFWNPSLSNKVTKILVAQSLFEAVHGLLIAFATCACIVMCTHSTRNRS